MMQAAGYQATGVDPEAPPGPAYRQVEFERYAAPGQLDAIVACTSLHHVADLAAVLDLAAGALAPGGRAVIVEWARERFDEATARWCSPGCPDRYRRGAAQDDRRAGLVHRDKMGAVRRPGNRDRELEVIAVEAGARRAAFLPVMQDNRPSRVAK